MKISDLEFCIVDAPGVNIWYHLKVGGLRLSTRLTNLFVFLLLAVDLPGGKLEQKLLESKNVYILDCHSEIFVWYVYHQVINEFRNYQFHLSQCYRIMKRRNQKNRTNLDIEY